jgi:hypothetical protein
MSSLAIEAFSYIRKGFSPPYYLENKIQDMFVSYSIDEYREIMQDIIQNEGAGSCLRYLSKNKLLTHLCTPLESMKRIPQDKGRSKNALEHTINVLDSVPIDNIILRWVALLHDTGKVDCFFNPEEFNQHGFHRHSKFSVEFAEIFCEVFQVAQMEKVIHIIKHHMEPLDYQRNPNWNQDAIVRFAERCGDDDVMDIIDFAYYDKKAETHKLEYLDPLIELREKVKNCGH